MATRQNLAITPALKNSDTLWFGPSGWARTTSAHATLPRTTAYAGTATGSVLASRAIVAAGKYVVGSAAVRFVVPSNGSIYIDWLTSGLTYLSSTTGVAYSGAASTTARLVSAVGQAPPDAARAIIVIAGVDGSMQVTAALVEQFDTLPEAEAAQALHADPAYYFDGDSTGEQPGWAAAWDGFDGASTSTLTYDLVASGRVSFGAMSIAGFGRVQQRGTGSVSFGAMSIFTGLIAQATYDDVRGRIRVRVTGAPSTAVRAEVYARPVGTTRWAPVRGGKVSMSGGSFSRTVDDYEYVAGADMEYRIVLLSSGENQQDQVIQTKIITVVAGLTGRAWLKFISAPYRNLPVQLTGWDDIERDARHALYEVAGRPDPIAVTDVHSSRTTTIQLRTATIADGERLDAALRSGYPAFLQTPASVALPSMYCVIGRYGYRRPAQRSLVRRWSVAITEVAAPPPSVVGAGRTYQSLLDLYATYAELLASASTYQAVMD